MKRTIAVLILALFVTVGAFASILQIGPAATVDFNPNQFNLESYKDVGKYQFGAEARVNLLFLQAGANASFSLPNSEGNWKIDTMLSANLVAGPKLVNVSVGAAIPYTFLLGPGASSIDLGSFLEQPLYLKAGLNFNFSFIGVGASYYIPTGLKVNEVVSEIQHISPDLSKGRLSLAVFFNFL